MSIGIKGSSSGGEFRSHIKFDARAGRMFRVDRVQTASGFESTPVDITQAAMFVADLANIRVGYINYTQQGPIKVMVVLGVALPPRPEGADDKGKATFKQGFEIDIVLHKSCAGATEGVREFSSTAGCVIEAIDELHDAYSLAPESKQGKLPAVKIVSTLPVKSGASTNYKPIFEIAAWVDRPAILEVKQVAAKTNGHTVTSTATKPAEPKATLQSATPPTTGSTQVAAPVAASAQAAPPVAAGDFG